MVSPLMFVPLWALVLPDNYTEERYWGFRCTGCRDVAYAKRTAHVHIPKTGGTAVRVANGRGHSA